MHERIGRTEQITVMMSEQEKELVLRAAKALHQTTSKYVRALLLNESKRILNHTEE